MEIHELDGQLDHPGDCPNFRVSENGTVPFSDHPALCLIAARPDIFSRQGNIAAAYRRRNGKTFGPYYSLRYRDDGRLCSVYLGRPSELVERVRQALAASRRSTAQRRLFRRLERSIRASLRIQKLHVASLLRPFGLRMKGFEVRGWRNCTIRHLLPRRRRISLRRPTMRRRPNNDPASRLVRFLDARDGPRERQAREPTLCYPGPQIPYRR